MRAETKCWYCAKATNSGCSWSADFIPVDGWVAIRRDLRIAKGWGKKLRVMKEESYRVLKCPEFTRDRYVEDKEERRDMTGQR